MDYNFKYTIILKGTNGNGKINTNDATYAKNSKRQGHNVIDNETGEAAQF